MSNDIPCATFGGSLVQDQTWAASPAEAQGVGSSGVQHPAALRLLSEGCAEGDSFARFNGIIFTSELLSLLRHRFTPSTESVHP